MGLAERKDKQRIGHDPRNLSWSDDKSRFSYKHMTSLGWTDKSGIGGSGLSGNPNHIAVVRKMDSQGIGMARARKEGDDLAAGAGQAGASFEEVLKRLAASGSASPAQEVVVEEVKVERPVVMRNKLASRQRHLQSKRLASASPAALAEILGVPISSLPSSPALTPAFSPSPSTPPTPTPETDRTADEVVSTSTLSVSDYFRQKLREKNLARQAAGGTSTPELAEGSLAQVKEEKMVAVGGVKWEGSKVQFDEAQVEVVVKEEEVVEDRKPDVAALEVVTAKATKRRRTEADEVEVTVKVEVEDKEAKRARKEAKRRAKEEKRVKKEIVG